MSPRKLPSRKGAIIELDDEDLEGEIIIHKNLTQDLLVTTEDKMKLALIEYRDVLISRDEWVSAGALVFSFMSPLLIANFRDAGPFTAETWRTIYFFFLALASYRFVTVFIKMTRNRHKSKIGYMINKMKQAHTSKEEPA
ncbi:MAG: hypothetical protein FWH51_02260 [Dehalococcoidia bacterium]|nr:hypothetical protein [Dehalococcoidia bacterium]